MKHGIRIVSNQEMRSLDHQADTEFLLDARTLMENAGRAGAQIILERYPHAGRDTEILVFAGKGNNAGDAFVIARRLMCLDRRVRIFHLTPENAYQGAVLRNFEILKRMKAKLTLLDSESELAAFFSSSSGPFTIIDGILGTGLKGDLEGIFYEVIERINAQRAQEVVSLDIPAGVSGDTGQVHGTSIQADLTISFGFPKMGHFLPPGAGRRGALVNVDISLPPKFKREGEKFLLTRSLVADLLIERDRYGHKNSFGHTLLIGGSPGRLGAIIMAALACHKIGTGLVTVASWEECFEALMIKLPNETMAVPLKVTGADFEIYKRNLQTYSSVTIGPGLGLRVDGKAILEELLSNYEGPVVIDADALNLIADHKLQKLLMQRKGPTVLTPHPGEMSRLLGISKDEIRNDPVTAVRRAVDATHSTVLLKGAATLVATVDERLYLNHYPNDGMATAGSGDVLAGMIGGLLGQHMDPFQATLLGIYLHSLAGDLAAQAEGHRGMTAQNIIENIGHAFKELKSPSETKAGPAAHLPQSAPYRFMEGRTWLR